MVRILTFCAGFVCLSAWANTTSVLAQDLQRPAMETLTFTHMADASAGEWLGNGLVVVGDDESNLLCVYRLPQAGAPVAVCDVSPWMKLEKKSREMDIEGSAKIGDTIYWITSHAPNKEGKPRPNRKRFFATRVTLSEGRPTFQLVGNPVSTLVADLARDVRYAAFDLAAASLLPPKTPGGLNIEALCDTPEGGLFIGFRAPNPKGQALLAPLKNPADAVTGHPPVFGDPVLLDLGGNGVRSMLRTGDHYLVMSGSALSGGTFRLYRWDGHAPTQHVPLPGLPHDANPEGMAVVEQDGKLALLVISDDGTELVEGLPAKLLTDPSRRTFRGFLFPFVP